MPYARKRRVARKRRRRRNPRFGRHRPTLIYGRGGWRRPKRSKLMTRKTRVNRRRRRKVSRRRRNYPLSITHRPNAIRRRRRNCATRRNPVRRYRRRRVRRNQPRLIRRLTSQRVLMSGLTIGGGIMAGAFTLPAVERLIPADNKAQFSKWLGLVNVALGAVMYGYLRNKDLKQLGLVVAGTGVYDLVQQNLSEMLPLPSIRADALVNKVMPMSASYGVARRPVSPVARLEASYGVPARAGYSGVAASYFDPSMTTQGFGSTDPYQGIEGWDG